MAPHYLPLNGFIPPTTLRELFNPSRLGIIHSPRVIGVHGLFISLKASSASGFRNYYNISVWFINTPHSP